VSKILAIDYGSKRVGVAITDSLKMIASGLSTVSTNEVYSFLDNIISKENISHIVVGLPKNLDNSNTDITYDVDVFINKLNQLYTSIVIDSIDERFTSSMAKKTILNSGVNKKRRANKALVDQVSATIILQSYLQKLNS
jgi:putative Holliday junction resolvase|tara:strand:+ start:13924 stop:14340 length:417 start_codon:yes stop_codon:yes gene_type:complete